ncbi:MAG TPA: transcription antitermination factor NusB [Thermomicrobiaceae bacterium]|nr:transcription antitermination factor NusB [Thermomicrobiaceae bacterium]
MSVALTRHQARTLALQVLFEVDVAGHQASDVLARYMADLALPQPVRRYVERLVTGVMQHLEEIDKQIGEAAPAFPVGQLPAVDRNILRIAIYELQQEPDVPVKAAINEAVELAKRFGGENSSRFVNGVLGTIASRLPPARMLPVAGTERGRHNNESLGDGGSR